MPRSPRGRVHAFLFRFGRRATLRGIELRALLPNGREWALIGARLDAALALLERHALVRHAMLRRDIRRLWVTGYDAMGAHVHDQAACVLDFDFVVDAATSPADVALLLVHEGTHAQLRRGRFGYDAAIRARIERRCIGRELVVARLLPGGAALAAGAERQLQEDDDQWSDAALRERRRAALRELGTSGRVGYAIGRRLAPLFRGAAR